MSAAPADLPILEPPSPAEWRAWLEANAATSGGVWLAVGKKGATRPTVSYEEAVEEALCFGWIDSVVNRLDGERFKQLFTPRKPGGTWSRSNKERVTRLIAEGRMTPAGLAVVEAAKTSGSWNALDEVEALVVPGDLAEALATTPGSKRGFAGLTESQRKMALYWISSAKRADTRARRIAKTAESAREGKMPF